MSEPITSETCRKYAEICSLRASRHMDIQQCLLFEALEKICNQAADLTDKAKRLDALRELQQESERLGLYGADQPTEGVK